MHTRFSQEGALSFILFNRKTAFLVLHLDLRASMIRLVLDMDAIVFLLALVLPLFVHHRLCMSNFVYVIQETYSLHVELTCCSGVLSIFPFIWFQLMVCLYEKFNKVGLVSNPIMSAALSFFQDRSWYKLLCFVLSVPILYFCVKLHGILTVDRLII